MGARNITKEFITRLIDNGKTAEGWRPSKSKGWVVGGVVGGLVGGLVGYGYDEYGMLTTFRDKVNYGRDWDFKDNWLKGDEKSGVEVAGKVYKYDMPGNFHYGFVGTAAGIGEGMLFTQAGIAQRAKGNSKPEYWCTDGDDPEDQEFIGLGIQLYKGLGLEVTESGLMYVLSWFSPKVCGTRPPEREMKGFKQ